MEMKNWSNTLFLKKTMYNEIDSVDVGVCYGPMAMSTNMRNIPEENKLHF